MDGLSAASATMRVVSLAIQAVETLTRLQRLISTFENDSERIDILVKQMTALSTALSEIAATEPEIQNLKDNIEIA
jgi:chaperonin cofactor prefoldin